MSELLSLKRDEVTGHLVGIEQAPVVPHPEVGAEYPRWVTPHPSHVFVGGQPAENLQTVDGSLIVPRDAVVSVPNFQHHIRRTDGAITVLVHDEDHEKVAQSERDDAHEHAAEHSVEQPADDADADYVSLATEEGV